jgi:hypothetical protein
MMYSPFDVRPSVVSSAFTVVFAAGTSSIKFDSNNRDSWKCAFKNPRFENETEKIQKRNETKRNKNQKPRNETNRKKLRNETKRKRFRYICTLTAGQKESTKQYIIKTADCVAIQYKEHYLSLHQCSFLKYIYMQRISII